jgi:hypothetical protein
MRLVVLARASMIACLLLVAWMPAVHAHEGHDHNVYGPIAADNVIPADPQPRWWKGNLHTHSYWSDGNDFPEMIAEWYRVRGYNFLALTDHNVLSQGMRWAKLSVLEKRQGAKALEKYEKRFGPHWVETRGDRAAGTLEVRLKPLDEFRALVEERGKFLMVQAEEISDKVGGASVHINASNIREVLTPTGGRTVREAIESNLRAAEEQAKKTEREIIVHLNHPNFKWAITAEDLAAVLSERFFEVYNGHPGVNHEGDKHRASTDEIWDVANMIRIADLNAPPLFGLGTDDSHNYHSKGGSEPGRGWIMVRARHLTPESLVRAMKHGDFYASSGVLLNDVRFDPETKTLSLQIQTDDDATYTTRFVGTPSDFERGSTERTDDEGKPLVTTRKYSADVGKTFATVAGSSPSYRLTGNELYVRAIVTSSKPPANPAFENQKAQAWTQPVGWQERVKPTGEGK